MSIYIKKGIDDTNLETFVSHSKQQTYCQQKPIIGWNFQNPLRLQPHQSMNSISNSPIIQVYTLRIKINNSQYNRIWRRQKLLNDHPTTLSRHWKEKKKNKTKQIQTLTILINIYYLLIMLKNNLPKPMPQS